jgi:nucleoid-associated protein YgaU
MKKNYLLLLGFVFLLAGCVVRTYPLTKDRIDQDLTGGNRGYLKGASQVTEGKEKKTTRTTQVVEVELRSPIRFERLKAKTQEKAITPQTEEEAAAGNRGYITQSTTPEIAEQGMVEKYTVQKNDTLQKISKKFYNTTKKWNKIYEANRDLLKSPNKLYTGQVLNIPVEPETKSLKEPAENLK